MTTTVAIRGMAALEHAQPDGGFAIYTPGEPVPSPIAAGDRLRIQLAVDDAAWLYAIAAIHKNQHWRFGAWAPGEPTSTTTAGVRALWPGGRVLTADDAAMTGLFIIASSEELPWARDLTRVDCSAVASRSPQQPPVTICDHLLGLLRKVIRIRGLVAPTIDTLADGSAQLPAIVAENHGAPYTVIEWLFKPRA
jgi:hypothetical protein